MLKWIMLLIYLLFCLYVWRHTLYSLDLKTCAFPGRKAVGGIYLFLVCSVFTGKILSDRNLKHFFTCLGNYWLGFLIYLVFFFFVTDIVLIIRKIIKQKNSENNCEFHSRREGFLIVAAVLAASTLFIVYGSIHQKSIIVSDYEIPIDKDGGKYSSLNMILIADLHLGHSIGSDDMEKMVTLINKENPDIVILAGDIFDNDYDALDDPKHLSQILSEIKCRLGVYAVYGNHDVKETLVGGFSVEHSHKALRDSRMEEFMKESGITVLEDVTVLVDDSFYLTGRLDGEKNGFGSAKRKSIEELTESVDKTKPLFVINHEPDELKEYAGWGVDLLLSGHTHAGQFFPLTLCQPLVWENLWGITKVDDMYSIVTSGVGIYGPPIRVLTDSEIMHVNIKFKKRAFS